MSDEMMTLMLTLGIMTVGVWLGLHRVLFYGIVMGTLVGLLFGAYAIAGGTFLYAVVTMVSRLR